MDPKKIRNLKKGPEAPIQEAIVNKLKMLDWVVKETHGNMYQWGVPDIYAAHKKYGARWIEVKDPNRKGELFTPAQISFFSELMSVGVGVWVLTSDSDREIALLHQEMNWWKYLGTMRH